MAQKLQANDFNNSLRGRLLGLVASNEYVAGLTELVGRAVGFLYGHRRQIAVGAALPGAAFGGLGCEDSGGYNPPPDPVAVVQIDKTQGPKPHTLEIDVSNSIGGTVHVDPGDGSPIQTEIIGVYADDGNPDGKVRHTYSQEGDYTVEAVAENEDGVLSDPDAEEIDVGYGSDNAGAADYIDGKLAADGYTCTRNQDCHIPDLRDDSPSPGAMHDYVADVKGTISDEIKYVIYDLGQLTADDLAIIAAFNAQMAATGVPRRVVVVNPDHSPDSIDDLLLGSN